MDDSESRRKLLEYTASLFPDSFVIIVIGDNQTIEIEGEAVPAVLTKTLTNIGHKDGVLILLEAAAQAIHSAEANSFDIHQGRPH